MNEFRSKVIVRRQHRTEYSTGTNKVVCKYRVRVRSLIMNKITVVSSTYRKRKCY